MLAATAHRLDGMPGLDRPIVVCNVEHVDQVRQQLPEASVIAEPVGRNTAAAIAAAALNVDGEAIMVVLPSDHLIKDLGSFIDAMQHAVTAAEDGWLVTFGVVPHHAATGFGYIRPGEPVTESANRIREFVEKPDADTAETLVANGYLWNSGMFVMRASRYLDELQSHRPDIAEAVASAVGEGFIEPLSWTDCPSESIDVAVMQETNRAAVVALDAGWSDIGSWSSLLELGPADEDGNVFNGNVISMGTHDSYVRADGRLVVVIGVEDLIVVETDDAVLVVGRDHAEAVKGVVDGLPESLL